MSRSFLQTFSMPARAGVGVWLLLLAFLLMPPAAISEPAGISVEDADYEHVVRGRKLVLVHACGDCHGGLSDPASEHWLAGQPDFAFAAGEFNAWPRNLTPDPETGLGHFSERQIFNAMRYGLRPSATPDVEISSPVPGQGNHPADPDYLSPAMPWAFFRYLSDQELRDIAAYLKRGLRPVTNEVPKSETPPDFWASESSVAAIGTHIPPPFPTDHERLPPPERHEQVLRGRQLVVTHACSACHGGAVNPAMDGWLVGVNELERLFDGEIQIGPFTTRPRNLTPHNTTGIGRFSERQLFNSLRYGLRPGETADVEITSTKPGEGNYPRHPKYLAPPMPWTFFRHLPDQALWDIAAYLKYGVKPVENRVEDSEGPPDFWVNVYTEARYGSFPAPAFPTDRERRIHRQDPHRRE